MAPCKKVFNDILDFAAHLYAPCKQVFKDILVFAAHLYASHPLSPVCNHMAPEGGVCGQELKSKLQVTVHRELVHGLLQTNDPEQTRVDATVEWCSDCRKHLVGRHAIIEDRLQHLESHLAAARSNPFAHEQLFRVLTINMTCPLCLNNDDLLEYERMHRFSSKRRLYDHNAGHLQLRADVSHDCEK